MMVFGTGTMVASKFMLGEKTYDKDGKKTDFNKALYQSFIMFLAMFDCYPVAMVMSCCEKLYKKKKGEVPQVLTREEKKAKRKESLKVFFF